MPGVIVTQHSGDDKANPYFLRGFNLDHGTDFATTVIGLPVNMPSHGHGQGETRRSSLSGEWHRHSDAGVTRVAAYAIDYQLKLFSNFTYALERPADGDQFSQQDRR